MNARYWFEQAARQGHLAAQYALAKLYLSDDLEVRTPRRAWTGCAPPRWEGNRWAMYRLGKELLKGQNTKQDAAGAVEWFTRSAEQGNPYAQYLLGKLYLTGKEVPRDEEQAVQWLTRSAEQGERIRPVPSGPPGGTAPARCDAGGDAAALSHEPGVPGQLLPESRPAASRSTASGSKSCGRRRSPRATSRTTMRNSGRK